MTANVIQFIEENMPDIVGAGFACGMVYSGIAILLGYVISKVQGLVVH